jgi:hypothetical protein
MGHSIQTFIGELPVLSAIVARTPGATIRRLKHPAIFVVPVPRSGFEPWSSKWTRDKRTIEFHRMLTRELTEFASECSKVGPLAYVETEYSGGPGHQNATVWRDGYLLRAPLIHVDESVAKFAPGGHPNWDELSASRPINGALALLGVRQTEDDDAFDVLGLRRVRSDEDFDELPIVAPAKP